MSAVLPTLTATNGGPKQISSEQVLKPIAIVYTTFIGINPLSTRRCRPINIFALILPMLCVVLYNYKFLPQLTVLNPTRGLKHMETLAWVTTFTWLMHLCVALLISVKWWFCGDVYKLTAAMNEISNGQGLYKHRFIIYAIQCVYVPFTALPIVASTLQSFHDPKLATILYGLFGVPWLWFPIFLWVTSMSPCVVFLCVTLIQMMICELDCYHYELKKLETHDRAEVQGLINRYGHITKALECLDAMSSTYLCLSFVVLLPTLIAVLFAMFSIDDPYLDPIGLMLFVIVFVVELFLLTWLPATLHYKLEDTPKLVAQCGAYWNSLDVQVQLMMLALYNQTVQHAAIDTNGFGRLTRGFILTVVSGVFTYLTVLLQMDASQPDDEARQQQLDKILNATRG